MARILWTTCLLLTFTFSCAKVNKQGGTTSLEDGPDNPNQDTDRLGTKYDDDGLTGPDTSMCKYTCGDVTKKLMKDTRQCGMRCARHAGAYSDMTDQDFHKELASVSDMCRVDDSCITEPQARHLMYNCLQQEAEITGQSVPGHRVKRAFLDSAVLWPTNTPILYTIDPTYTATETARIEYVLDVYRNNTCIQFQLTMGNTHDGLHFFKGTSCTSFVGKVATNPQNVELAAGCLNDYNFPGVPVHEVLHALGVLHEQVRSDRDTYLTYFPGNVRPGAEVNFEVAMNSQMTTSFDMTSVMLYEKTIFGVNGATVLQAKDPALNSALGQRRMLSFLDLLELNTFYCNDTCADAPIICMNDGYPNPADCTKCICPPAYNQPDNQCSSITANDASECTGTQITLTEGSPQATITMADYSREFACAWQVVNGVAGYNLSVNAVGDFHTFSFNGDCTFQWLEIYDGTKPFEVVPRYCRLTRPTNVQFDTTSVIIVLTIGFLPPSPTGRFTLDVSLVDDIDECESFPCQNGATCTNQLGGFMCNCIPGFTSIHCEVDIDECNPNPCMNGATCIDGVHDYVCECAAGFTEDRCQSNIDECTSEPCQNGGTCVDDIIMFICDCPPGYEGHSCQIDIDECTSEPCQNDGICNDGIDGFTCNCTAGYVGTECQTETAGCTSGPCRNDGTCSESSPGPGYLCSCASPFEGYHCEVDPPLSLIVGVTVQVEWMDDFTERDCDTILPIDVICQEVQISFDNYQSLNIRFLGVAPTTTEHTALYLEINMTASQYLGVTSGFQRLVNFGNIQNIQVNKAPTFLSVLDHEVLIYDVKPRSGPVAGGTPITITGQFIDSVLSVNLGSNKCFIDLQNPVLIICNSSKLANKSLATETIDILLEQASPLLSVVTGFKFTYLPDPTISDVHPLVTVLTGSVILTVEGANLLSPKVRRMETTVKRNTTQSIFITPCYGIEPNRMFCKTPDITQVVANAKRRKREISTTVLLTDRIRSRRQNSPSLNDELDFDVAIAFILDGVPDYRNLTAANLEEFSELTVYADPVVHQYNPSTLKFTSTWPVEERIIEIKGERLLDGLQEKDYIVQIGRAVCSNVKVLSNLIVCEPPLQRPTVADEDYRGYNKIPIQVTFASQQNFIGHLEYIQTIWEYPQGRYGIIGGICGLILLIATIILLIVLRQMRNRNSAGRDPVQNQLNLVSRVKRWSRRQGAPSSTFIPRARVRTDTYNNTVSDIRTVPFRTRPGTYIEDGPYNLDSFEPYYTTYRN